MKKLISRVLGTCLFLALVFGGAWYIWGTTTVIATIDGQEVAGAKVFIDDEFVGQTPYKARLGFGYHKITVMPPDGSSVQQEQFDWSLFTVVRGSSFEASFEGRSPFADVPVSCEIDGDEVGDCDVFMDDKFVGKTPMTLPVPDGVHKVRVSAPEGIDTEPAAWTTEGTFDSSSTVTGAFTLR